LEEGNNNERRRREEVLAQADRTSEVYSFDVLAMGMADGTITRGRALKLMGAVVLGGLGAMVGISAAAGDADARRKKGKHKRRQHTKNATSMCLFSCTSGCCVGNDCKAGNTTQFCGTGGGACVTCATGESCLNGTNGRRQCCPPSRTCGSICCSTGQSCTNPVTGTCV
jgi:hypothetical protein